ncbi:hypothetical protein AB205_0059600 [Aquarana catesbeiana]|uniref:Uncharacterized protein n=1 Tax=Aquarana catesbeiana TaxID=8400 RepID=A0A2G9NZ06_AQUCT|nr:hypothetical protein AB205_0059600 [Aquarana catesbeiana]
MIFFPIRPIQLGEIPIMVKAISSLASDAVIQRLLVKAEGIEHSYSQTLLLELMNNKPQNISKALNFTFPPDVVSGSEKAFITVVGKDNINVFKQYCNEAVANISFVHPKEYFLSVLCISFKCTKLLFLSLTSEINSKPTAKYNA